MKCLSRIATGPFALLLCVAAGVPLQARAAEFRDLGRNVYAPEIGEAANLGFVAGFPDNTFRPHASVTREQVVSLVLEALRRLAPHAISIDGSVSERPFPDVGVSRWSAAKIAFARDNNIVMGYQDGTFRPAQAVSRAELVSMLRRAAEFGRGVAGLPSGGEGDAPASPGSGFADVGGHWAESAVTEMAAFCRVASPLDERGSRFFPDAVAYRDYATAATLRMLKCLGLDSQSPDEPDLPEDPHDPDHPDEPYEPDHPDEPYEPDHPDEPYDPDHPDEPHDPDHPDEPYDPDNPRGPHDDEVIHNPHDNRGPREGLDPDNPRGA